MQSLDLLRKEGVEVGNSRLFLMLLPALYFWGIICVCSSIHALFSNLCLIFPLSSHGKLLDCMLSLCPKLHSAHHITLFECRHGKNEPFCLLINSLIDLWHGVSKDFTSQLAPACDAVYCRPWRMCMESAAGGERGSRTAAITFLFLMLCLSL